MEAFSKALLDLNKRVTKLENEGKSQGSDIQELVEGIKSIALPTIRKPEVPISTTEVYERMEHSGIPYEQAEAELRDERLRESES